MTILSDCKPAVQIFNKLPTTTPARILRFVLRVQDINYVIKHIDGKENPSDWLSRITHFHQDDLKYHTQSAELETAIVKSIQIQHNHLTLDQIKNETNADPDMDFLKLRIKKNDFNKFKKYPRIKPFLHISHELNVIDSLIYKNDVIVLPLKLRHMVVELVHNISHSGETATKNIILDSFYFPSISNFTQAHISLCSVCKAVNPVIQKEPLGIEPVSDKPFQKIAMDFKGPLENGSYILAIIDLFSQFVSVYFQ